MSVHVALEFAARTDTGLVRTRNEDAIALSADSGIAILADGMGGYNAGEVASGIAVETIKEVLGHQLAAFDWTARVSRTRRLCRMLVDAVKNANASILAVAQSDPRCSGMGTTVVVALFHHDKLLVAHVGDSRLYRWRQGELTLLTRDHSLLQEQVDAGLIDAEQARLSPDRNLITRALGVDMHVDVEVHEHATQVDDVYLLCSDGLSDMLSANKIATVLRERQASLILVGDTLVDEANAYGGRDNTSVIIVRVLECVAEIERMATRLLKWLR